MVFRFRRRKKKDPPVFLGFSAADNMPIWAPMSSLMRHAVTIGSSGSGKTAELLRVIDTYLLRGDTSIVVLDMKSDSYEILQTMLSHKWPTWVFTDRQGNSSHLFSLFHQDFWANLNPVQKADIEQASMGMTLSRAYGASWYTDAQLSHMVRLQKEYPNINNFAEQAGLLDQDLRDKRSNIHPSVRKDGAHSLLVLQRLALCDSVNYRNHYPQEVLDRSIDLARLFREPCCLYAGLSATLSPIAAPEIGRLLLSALLMTGMHMTPNERKMKVILIIDECQTLVTAAAMLKRALEQARSLNISVVLSSQLAADFKLESGEDLTSTVFGNTNVQSWHAVRDELGISQLIALGGKTLELQQSLTIGNGPNGETEARTYQEFVINRYEANQILAASSKPNHFFVRIADMPEFRGLPFLARCPYHISEAEYKRRVNAPWPAQEPGMIVVGDTEPRSEDKPKTSRKTPEGRSRLLGEGIEFIPEDFRGEI